MHINDQKTGILEALKLAQKPLTAGELHAHLEHGTLSARTLGRRLQELVNAGLLIRHGQGRNTQYLVLEQNEPNDTPSALLFSADSQLAISYVTQPAYLRNPVSYNPGWLDRYQPNQTFYLSKTQRDTLASQGYRTEYGDIAGTYARHIYNRLLIDLSYNSSRLEGNTYSLIDTEKLILEGISAQTKLDEEKVMILNHKEAIRYLIDNASKITISEDTIYTIHYLLSDGLLPKEQCGTLRQHAVKIGGSNYFPLDNTLILQNTLKIICEKANLILNPFEQSFFMLVNLAYLQGFEDCNKRTSRLCANIPLIQKNFVPLSFNDIPKNDYINAMLAIYELNDIHPLVDLFCFSYARACKIYDATAISIGIDRLRIIYRDHRRMLTTLIIQKNLHGNDMHLFLETHISQHIPNDDRASFLNIMKEDINLLTYPRVAGMGISRKQFEDWKHGEPR